MEKYKGDHKINTIKISKRKRGRNHSEKIGHHEKLIIIVKKNQIEILEIRILTNKIKYWTTDSAKEKDGDLEDSSEGTTQKATKKA